MGFAVLEKELGSPSRRRWRRSGGLLRSRGIGVAAGSRGAAAIGGLPVVPAGAAGVVGGGGNAGQCRQWGKGCGGPYC
jgi:hypothetical protein